MVVIISSSVSLLAAFNRLAGKYGCKRYNVSFSDDMRFFRVFLLLIQCKISLKVGNNQSHLVLKQLIRENNTSFHHHGYTPPCHILDSTNHISGLMHKKSRVLRWGITHIEAHGYILQFAFYQKGFSELPEKDWNNALARLEAPMRKRSLVSHSSPSTSLTMV